MQAQVQPQVTTLKPVPAPRRGGGLSRLTHLARLEATIVFELLTQRLHDLARTAEPLQRIPYVGLRGLQSLPLTFEAGAAVR